MQKIINYGKLMTYYQIQKLFSDLYVVSQL